MKYCAWLTQTRGADVEALVGGGGLACLPTEAEWEYACRAGTDTEHYTGDGKAALAEAGWFDEDWDKGSTHPVAIRKPNVFGLFDMHGNVWEWCHDPWDADAYRARLDGIADPGSAERWGAWSSGLDALERDNRARVLRGGSGLGGAGYCRSASRDWFRPDDRDWYDGFRVCLVRGPAAVSRGARSVGQRGSGAGAGRRRARDEPGVERRERRKRGA
jgi:formylglycine-generating enzyme required for sulfatase activity